jgi:hypothetical protein
VTRRALVRPFGLLVLLALAGCPPSGQQPPATETPAAPLKSGTIDVAGGPQTSTMVTALKQGRPFVLVDMLPEAPKLAGWDDLARTAYLRRRALMIAKQATASKPELANKPEAAVRMILLKDKDEYNQPRWETAPELALFELTTPPAELDPAKAPDEELAKHVKSAQVHLEVLGPAP